MGQVNCKECTSICSKELRSNKDNKEYLSQISEESSSLYESSNIERKESQS
jgi:hypothetical protein